MSRTLSPVVAPDCESLVAIIPVSLSPEYRKAARLNEKACAKVMRSSRSVGLFSSQQLGCRLHLKIWIWQTCWVISCQTFDGAGIEQALPWTEVTVTLWEHAYYFTYILNFTWCHFRLFTRIYFRSMVNQLEEWHENRLWF